jgi:hypothetical protein
VWMETGRPFRIVPVDSTSYFDDLTKDTKSFLCWLS